MEHLEMTTHQLKDALDELEKGYQLIISTKTDFITQLRRNWWNFVKEYKHDLALETDDEKHIAKARKVSE